MAYISYGCRKTYSQLRIYHYHACSHLTYHLPPVSSISPYQIVEFHKPGINNLCVDGCTIIYNLFLCHIFQYLFNSFIMRVFFPLVSLPEASSFSDIPLSKIILSILYFYVAISSSISFSNNFSF